VERATKGVDLVRERSPYLRMVQAGHSPEEIKAFVYAMLEPFGLNSELLRCLILQHLAPIATDVARVRLVPGHANALDELLSVFERALQSYIRPLLWSALGVRAMVDHSHTGSQSLQVFS
jgi:hypothetical protein